MAQHRTRKQKETPHYQFMVSWQPKDSSQAHVKGESASTKNPTKLSHNNAKSANLLTKDGVTLKVKKDIIKSLIVVSFVLILEVVVYLAMLR